MHRVRQTQAPGPVFPFVVVFGVGSLLIYFALLQRFPLFTLYTAALQNLNHMAPHEGPKALFVGACFVLLFASYALGAIKLATAPADRWTLPLLLAFPLLFCALLLLIQPITSTDLYDYLFRGRMLARYGVNTFVTPPYVFADDPLFGYVAWSGAVTAYGPLWEQLSWITARLAGEAPGVPFAPSDLLRLLLAYKALSTLGFLLCGAVIWATLRHTAPQWRWFGLYSWLWNPLVLWEAVVAGHNDVWLVLFMLMALWIGALGREPEEQSRVLHYLAPTGALVMLTAGGLIKFVTFFFGPVVLAAALRSLSNWRERLRLVLLGGLACAALLLLAYGPLWSGWATVQNIGARGTLFNISWLAAAHLFSRDLLGAERAASLATWVSMALLLLGMLWATWRAWRAPQQLATHLLWLVLWFLFVCNPWFQPWYLIWPLGLLAVQPWRVRMRWAMVLFGLTALLSYLLGGWVLPVLGVPWASASREAVLALCVYLPPLIVLAWGRWNTSPAEPQTDTELMAQQRLIESR